MYLEVPPPVRGAGDALTLEDGMVVERKRGSLNGTGAILRQI